MLWHYARGGAYTGPFTTEEVCAKLVQDGFPADALVWRDGFSDWKEPNDCAEFRRANMPPPLPVQSPPRSKLRKWLDGVLMFFGYLFLAFGSTSMPDRGTPRGWRLSRHNRWDEPLTGQQQVRLRRTLKFLGILYLIVFAAIIAFQFL